MNSERIKLEAPLAIWTEVANGLARAVRRGRLEVTQAIDLADQIGDVSWLIDVVAIEPREILRTALSVGIGAYDAEYLAAARHVGSSDHGRSRHARARARARVRCRVARR
jgi:predicted nucleic acid-binding protein